MPFYNDPVSHLMGSNHGWNNDEGGPLRQNFKVEKRFPQ